jgi:hypothetical protein
VDMNPETGFPPLIICTPPKREICNWSAIGLSIHDLFTMDS